MDQPSQFEPRAVLGSGRRSRARVIAAVVTPVLALVLVAGIGVAGPTPERDRTARQAEDQTAPATPAPESPSPTPAPRTGGHAYPDTVLGLEVRGVEAARDASGQVAPVAVAGWFVADAGGECAAPPVATRSSFLAELGVVADPATFCQRSGRLYGSRAAAVRHATGASVLPWDASAQAWIPVAVTPGAVVPTAADGSGAATQVVVVGRILYPGVACIGRPACRGVLHVDRVVWSAGLGRAPSTSALPRLLETGPRLASRPRDRLAAGAIGRAGPMLIETLVDPATLRRVDPLAAEVVASTAPGAARIWYRLVLGANPPDDPLRWVAIDDATGTVVASGTVPAVEG